VLIDSDYICYGYCVIGLIPVAVRWSADARVMGSRPAGGGAGMFVPCVRCVDSGLCDRLITRLGESYGYVCV
jgi:hypothetical protein